MKSKLASILALLQLLVVFLSWLVTAVAPQLYTRSLLSGEGIRWFLGRFADNLAHPLLVWLILIAIAWGTLSRSTLPSALLKLSRRQPVLYRQRFGLRVVAIELVLFAVVVLLLTAVPQAILLSASGQLFPSSFSSSLIPLLAFIVTFVSVSFGLACGVLSSLAHICDALTSGLRAHADWLLIYVLAMQLWFSVRFILQHWLS